MTDIKHPFDYLDESDHIRINKWLNNPNPDIDSAVKTLGINKEELLQALEKADIPVERSEVAIQKDQFFKCVYELKGSRSAPLNLILEPLYAYFSEQIDEGAISLKTRRRRTYLFGSGTPEYLEATITLQYAKLSSEVIREVERLIEKSEHQGFVVSVKKYDS